MSVSTTLDAEIAKLAKKINVDPSECARYCCPGDQECNSLVSTSHLNEVTLFTIKHCELILTKKKILKKKKMKKKQKK